MPRRSFREHVFSTSASVAVGALLAIGCTAEVSDSDSAPSRGTGGKADGYDFGSEALNPTDLPLDGEGVRARYDEGPFHAYALRLDQAARIRIDLEWIPDEWSLEDFLDLGRVVSCVDDPRSPECLGVPTPPEPEDSSYAESVFECFKDPNGNACTGAKSRHAAGLLLFRRDEDAESNELNALWDLKVQGLGSLETSIRSAGDFLLLVDSTVYNVNYRLRAITVEDVQERTPGHVVFHVHTTDGEPANGLRVALGPVHTRVQQGKARLEDVYAGEHQVKLGPNGIGEPAAAYAYPETFVVYGDGRTQRPSTPIQIPSEQYERWVGRR
jgi:hypothetical protein